jgi:hypothetical protein
MMGMRFSIQPKWGINKFHADLGTATIEIRPRSLLSNTYQWTWTDGQPMSAKIPIAPTATNVPVLTVGDAMYSSATCALTDPAAESVWEYGNRVLLHRAAYRCRFKTWRAWWRARARHVLEFDDGITVAAWFGEGNHRRAFDGVIRRSLSDELARVVFGIIMCVYLSERTDP